MKNTSTNHYHSLRLIGRILQPCALFSQMSWLTEQTQFTYVGLMTSKQVRLISGGVFFALLLVYCAASFYVWFYPPGSDGGWHGSGTFGAIGEIHITRVDPQSPAKDLRPGDKVIAINGVKVVEQWGIMNVEYRLPPGSPYS